MFCQRCSRPRAETAPAAGGGLAEATRLHSVSGVGRAEAGVLSASQDDANRSNEVQLRPMRKKLELWRLPPVLLVQVPGALRLCHHTYFDDRFSRPLAAKEVPAHFVCASKAGGACHLPIDRSQFGVPFGSDDRGPTCPATRPSGVAMARWQTCRHWRIQLQLNRRTGRHSINGSSSSGGVSGACGRTSQHANAPH